jgi:hypothetical protein
MGEKPRALVIYTSDGHVATIFTGAERTAPATPRPTDGEASQLYRSMVAFAGRYELEGDSLAYYPEVSWNETWNGTKQMRLVEMSDDQLHVKSVPAVSTLTGATTVMTMAWERVEPGNLSR